jgi:hypothetical protein
MVRYRGVAVVSANLIVAFDSTDVSVSDGKKHGSIQLPHQIHVLFAIASIRWQVMTDTCVTVRRSGSLLITPNDAKRGLASLPVNHSIAW